MMLGLIAAAAMNAPLQFYIGTYTSLEGSQGIYRSALDPANGQLSKPQLVAKVSNPSYLAFSKGHDSLFAVTESTDGSVSSFQIQPGGDLQAVNSQPCLTADPCDLCLDASGTNLLVAGYSGGTVTCLPIGVGAKLSPVSSRYVGSGGGPDKGRQEQAHMHCVQFDAGRNLVYGCNLGSDEVFALRLDAHAHAIAAAWIPQAKVPAGHGPRHMALSADAKFAYVNAEMGCSVSVFQISSDGHLKLVQTLSTLPRGSTLEGNSTAEIAIAPNQRTLYISNRGANGIAAFDIQPNGMLKLIGISPAGVKNPRGFAIDPTGRWLVVAGQDSGDLVSLPIDPQNGSVGSAGSMISLSKPVCVLFR